MPKPYILRRIATSARPTTNNPNGPGRALMMWRATDRATGQIIAQHIDRAAAERHAKIAAMKEQ